MDQVQAIEKTQKKATRIPRRLPSYVVLQKKRGVTPLETVAAWKQAHAEEICAAGHSLADFPAAYAGRLDPMAEGKLLVLLGDECKKMEKYTGLDKEYVIEVLLDFSTDSGDALGLPKQFGAADVSKKEIVRALQDEVGTHARKYPIFSSKTVQGKPLFLYALEGTIDSITIPEHKETVYAIHLLENKKISKNELQTRIAETLREVPRSNEPSKKLGADFRQDEIRARWHELFDAMGEREFTILKLRVTCGSGAYMRTLAARIGESLGTGALALSIMRTKIGNVVHTAGLTIWTKQF